MHENSELSVYKIVCYWHSIGCKMNIPVGLVVITIISKS